MRIRRQIASESGTGQLVAGGLTQSVSYTLVAWGTFEGDTLCVRELHGSLEGNQAWPSGAAELRLEDGRRSRILLRKCGTFAMGDSLLPPL